MLKGRENLLKFALMLLIAFGGYLIVAWASYSPLDNGWTIAGTVTTTVLNKTGHWGAVTIDVLLAMFGKVALLLPLGVSASALYLLILGKVGRIKRGKMALWLLGFVLLMLGLSGLASVLLAPTPYYLAGGFIGEILSQWSYLLLGRFGSLITAMLLTSVGFYFCSGQVILQLFNRTYQWIFVLPSAEKHLDVTTPESEPSGQGILPVAENRTVQFEPAFVQQEQRKKSVFSEEKERVGEIGVSLPQQDELTDLSHFIRPKITGLKPIESVKQVDIEPALERENVTVEMPTITLNQPLTDFSSLIPPAESFAPTEEVAFEKVQSPEYLSDENDEPPFEMNSDSLFVPPTIPEMPKVRLNPSASPLPNSENPPLTLTSQKAEEPDVSLVKPAKTVVEKASEEPINYPKGYGKTLIHPLLQQKTKLEKPTTPLPTLDLLEQKPSEVQQITEEEILQTSARIEQELANFGVKATVEDVLVGPVVTRYEIKPAAGVKASKITNLDSDLARALIFKAIRITDVVPGKPYMGIETPNKQRETVWLRDVLSSESFQNSNATLPMALGKDISGEPVVVDMAKMPHLLVAGQTGGGKSVGVNTMILSLLYKLTPDQVRFIMIDPKVVELSIYNDIPHLLTPVVTDMKKAENALRWAVEEMERRYLLVSSLSVRNIEGYNDKIRQAQEMGIPIPNPLWRPGDTMDALPPPLEKLTYIVLIVDEFADLMMSAGKQVEDHIMRIAQKARAVGIHLILATQRPSTDVITGVIKANIPSRIAFTVASQIDSRTILDKGGAESLLGRGDMLYSGAGSPDIIRIHGAFMSDDVQRVADNWRARSKPSYIDSIVESLTEEEESGDARSVGELDPKFDEIAQYVIDGGLTSISGIQRRFALGFNRAARIIDQLEAEGILSAPDSRGKREVLAR